MTRVTNIQYADECTPHLEAVFGEHHILKAPTSLIATKPAFRIKHPHKFEVLTILINAGIERAHIDTNTMLDDVFELTIPKQSATEYIQKIIDAAEDIANTAKIIADREKAKKNENILKYKRQFGEAVTRNNLLQPPEILASIYHKIKLAEQSGDKETAALHLASAFEWVRQDPSALMMAITPEGKIGIADDEQTKILTKAYNDKVKERNDDLNNDPRDRVFNKKTGEVEYFPAGTIHNKLKNGKQVGPGTYINTNKQAWYQTPASSEPTEP